MRNLIDKYKNFRTVDKVIVGAFVVLVPIGCCLLVVALFVM